MLHIQKTPKERKEVENEFAQKGSSEAQENAQKRVEIRERPVTLKVALGRVAMLTPLLIS